MRTKVPATSKGWVKWHNCIEKKNFFLFPHADHLIRNPRQTNLHMNTVSFKNVTYFSIICNYCNYFRSISIRKKRTMNQYAYWLIGSESSNTKLNCLYGRSVLYSLFQVFFWDTVLRMVAVVLKKIWKATKPWLALTLCQILNVTWKHMFLNKLLIRSRVFISFIFLFIIYYHFHRKGCGYSSWRITIKAKFFVCLTM